jgi:hypothetical protein
MRITDRDRLISRLAAAVRTRGVRCEDRERLARCIEEHLSEVRADGAMYDSLRERPGKFAALVGAVSRVLKQG